MKIIDGFVLRRVGSEYIVSGEGLGQVNLNRMFALNDSAAMLWKEIEGREFDNDLLADLLVEHYGIERERALTDAAKISGEWVKAGMAR
jgi:hypothetical protein